MATALKVDRPQRKATGKVLTHKQVAQAAQDGQKSFERFVATGKLPVQK